jgi:hypothetical protein
MDAGTLSGRWLMAKLENRYELFRDAIRRRVCSSCLDQRDDGTCGLSHRTCAIEAHLPGIVEAIAGVDSDRMDDYITAIEAQVCSECENGPGLVCSLRKHGDCALDTYLYLVVDAVEDIVKGQKAS